MESPSGTKRSQEAEETNSLGEDKKSKKPRNDNARLKLELARTKEDKEGLEKGNAAFEAKLVRMNAANEKLHQANAALKLDLGTKEEFKQALMDSIKPATAALNEELAQITEEVEDLNQALVSLKAELAQTKREQGAEVEKLEIALAASEAALARTKREKEAEEIKVAATIQTPAPPAALQITQQTTLILLKLKQILLQNHEASPEGGTHPSKVVRSKNQPRKVDGCGLLDPVMTNGEELFFKGTDATVYTYDSSACGTRFVATKLSGKYTVLIYNNSVRVRSNEKWWEKRLILRNADGRDVMYQGLYKGVPMRLEKKKCSDEEYTSSVHIHVWYKEKDNDEEHRFFAVSIETPGYPFWKCMCDYNEDNPKETR
jgi:hypothetical protein